jgi:hypothetical protein
MRIVITIIALLVGSYANGDCLYDKKQMLSLELNEFDQNMNGGWRKIAGIEGCKVTAANLIQEYRIANYPNSSALFWHEGQLRAGSGEVEKAIVLFKKSKIPDQHDTFGWNYYVDASIAFLEKDKESLIKSRDLLSSVPKPAELKMVDASGKPVKMKWPPNLSVVDSLIQCFEKAYDEAYANCKLRDD